jgi:hypothetical protein
MGEILVYTVEVHDKVDVQAASAEEAKQKALDHWAQAPMNIISVTSSHKVLTPD